MWAHGCLRAVCGLLGFCSCRIQGCSRPAHSWLCSAPVPLTSCSQPLSGRSAPAPPSHPSVSCAASRFCTAQEGRRFCNQIGVVPRCCWSRSVALAQAGPGQRRRRPSRCGSLLPKPSEPKGSSGRRLRALCVPGALRFGARCSPAALLGSLPPPRGSPLTPSSRWPSCAEYLMGNQSSRNLNRKVLSEDPFQYSAEENWKKKEICLHGCRVPHLPAPFPALGDGVRSPAAWAAGGWSVTASAASGTREFLRAHRAAFPSLLLIVFGISVALFGSFFQPRPLLPSVRAARCRSTRRRDDETIKATS